IFMFVVQVGGIVISALSYNRTVNNHLAEGIAESSVIEAVGMFSLAGHMYHLYFVGPLFLSLIGILFYTFFIWYRDWLGKNTFIYRLLTLPSSRMNVYFSKLLTIFLTGLVVAAFQLIIIFLQNQLVHLIVPDVFRVDLSTVYVTRHFSLLLTMFPVNVSEFISYQLLSILFIVVIFTAILLERSYRLIGLVYGVVYAFVMFLIFLSPTIVQFILGYEYFYPSELVMLLVVTGVIVLVSSLLFSRYLMNKKVTV